MSLQFSMTLRTARAACLLTQINGADAAAWLATHGYSIGNTVRNSGHVYVCTAGGTSASSGGPSGTGSGIGDGGATWAYSAPFLKLFSGGVPGSVAAGDPSGPLATISLPSPCLVAASAASTIAGTWSGSASATGTAASWRIYDGAGNCQLQGNVATDLSLSTSNLVSGQAVTVTNVVITEGNA